ncbi:MAG: hypothetical protein NVS3B20_06330 [Polyangiales bacterium]
MEPVGEGLHCCWPGQEWSSAIQKCVGLSRCGAGFESTDQGCRSQRICEPGKVIVDDAHCCWFGQHWATRADGTEGCSGAPACPTPTIARGEECISPDAARARDSAETRAAIFGAQSLNWYLGVGFGFHDQSITSTSVAIGGAYHFAGFPLRLAGEVDYGVYKYPDAPCSGVLCDSVHDSNGVYYAYALGAHLAPFSIANATTNFTSLINPFVGVDYRAQYFSPRDLGFKTPSPGGQFLIDAGNVSFFGHLSLTTSYGFGLGGNDARLRSLLQLSVGLSSRYTTF